MLLTLQVRPCRVCLTHMCLREKKKLKCVSGAEVCKWSNFVFKKKKKQVSTSGLVVKVSLGKNIEPHIAPGSYRLAAVFGSSVNVCVNETVTLKHLRPSK